MYISYIDEVPESYYLQNRAKFKDNIYLTTTEEVENILVFINHFGIQKYKEIFDVIGIKYDDIANNGLTYSISNKTLPISRLSSGERMLLYSYILSYLDKSLILIGLTDRMDMKHMKILKNYYKDFNLVILVFDKTTLNNNIVNEFYKPFAHILEEGVLK